MIETPPDEKKFEIVQKKEVIHRSKISNHPELLKELAAINLHEEIRTWPKDLKYIKETVFLIEVCFDLSEVFIERLKQGARNDPKYEGVLEVLENEKMIENILRIRKEKNKKKNVYTLFSSRAIAARIDQCMTALNEAINENQSFRTMITHNIIKLLNETLGSFKWIYERIKTLNDEMRLKHKHGLEIYCIAIRENLPFLTEVFSDDKENKITYEKISNQIKDLLPNEQQKIAFEYIEPEVYATHSNINTKGRLLDTLIQNKNSPELFTANRVLSAYGILNDNEKTHFLEDLVNKIPHYQLYIVDELLKKRRIGSSYSQNFGGQPTIYQPPPPQQTIYQSVPPTRPTNLPPPPTNPTNQLPPATQPTFFQNPKIEDNQNDKKNNLDGGNL